MRKTLAISALAALTIVVYAAGQDPVLLRKSLKVDSTESYKVTLSGTQSVDVPSMGPMDMGFNGSYNWIFKTTAVDAAKNEADVDVTIKDMKFEMTGPMQMPDAPMPKDVISKMKIDSRYKLTQSKLTGQNMQMMLAMGAASAVSPFIELPESNVKIGDSWTVTIPKSMMIGDLDVKLKASFSGEGSIEDKRGYKLEMTGQLPVNMDLSKIMEEMAKSGTDPSGGMMGDMKMTMTGTMDVKVVSIVDKATGTVLATTMTIGSNMNVNLVDMGMSMPAKGSTTIKLISN